MLTELVRCLKALQEPVNLAVRSGKDASRVDLNVQGLRELHFLVAIDLECDEVADDGSPDFLVGKGLGLSATDPEKIGVLPWLYLSLGASF